MCLFAGVEAPNIARLVEEHIMKNRKVRARAERKRRGLPPHRLRRKPSEIPEQDIRSFSDRKERRQRDAATRLGLTRLCPLLDRTHSSLCLLFSSPGFKKLQLC